MVDPRVLLNVTHIYFGFDQSQLAIERVQSLNIRRYVISGPNRVWVPIYNISSSDFGSGYALCNDFLCKSDSCLWDLINA